MQPLPRRPRNRRKLGLLTLVTVILLSLAIGYLIDRSSREPALLFAFVNRPYSPQPGRNAEWVGNSNGSFTPAQTRQLARNDGYVVIPKFADGYRIEKHFVEARNLVAAANAQGRTIRVFEYFNLTYWPLVNRSAWGQYAVDFDPSWYLHDSRGRPIAFYGAGRKAFRGGKVVGYLTDLANPGFRDYVVRTITSWMQQAPYAGVAFDSANPLLGRIKRSAIGNGGNTFNDLLCGRGAPTASDGNCAHVSGWNAGLRTVIAEASDALHKTGKQLIYNGIAPGPQRGASRNIEPLDDADMAANEGFCYTATTDPGIPLRLNSFQDDAAIMKRAAARRKKVLQITNFAVASNNHYGAYCLAGFLMGWQPGYDFWTYHKTYNVSAKDSFPILPEQNLALGDPQSPDYQRIGEVLTRRFSHGMAAVNTGDTPATMTLPYEAVSFAGGKPVDTYAAGAGVLIAPRSGMFFLTTAYLLATGR